MKITTTKIVDFLQDNGWINKGQDKKFVYFQPPSSLGIEETYFLPVPMMESSDDFHQVIMHTVEVLEQIYEARLEDLFYEAGDFHSHMLKNAIYVKLSAPMRSDHALEVNHVTKFLQHLSNSFRGYLAVEFTQRFADRIRENIGGAARQIVNLSPLRFVDLKFQSFSFGVSMDPTMGRSEIELKGVNDWRDQVLPAYENEVLNQDFDDGVFINEIMERYSPEERKIIFDPLFKALNNNEYTVHLTTSSYNKKKRLYTVSKSVIQEIVPKIKAEEESKSLSFIQVVLPVTEEGKLDVRSPKKAIESGGLFSQPVTNIHLPRIERDNITFEFKEPIQFRIGSTQLGEYVLQSPGANFEVKSTTFPGVQSTLLDLLWSLYDHFKSEGDLSYLLPNANTQVISRWFEQGTEV